MAGDGGSRLRLRRWSARAQANHEEDVKGKRAAPAVLNAADEVAVQAFLDRRIAFTDIPRLIENALEAHQGSSSRITFENVMAADTWARRFSLEKVDRVRMAKS